MSSPMISVIIPTYQRYELTCRATESALGQSWKGETEIIITDNGSKDGSVEKLETRFANEIASGKLRVLKNPPSGDPGLNRNHGAQVARGTFLAFLDSDDWWDLDRLEKIAPKLDALDYVIEPDQTIPAGGDALRFYLQMNLGAMSSIIIRKSVFDRMGGFPAPNFGPQKRLMPTYEDYELTLRVLLEIWREAPERVWIRNAKSVHTEVFADGFNRIQRRDQMVREANLLMRYWLKTPPKYWPLIARRLAGCAKAVALNPS